MRVGQRITVYGDVEIMPFEEQRVQVRVHRASSPPPEPVARSHSERLSSQKPYRETLDR
jgi:hypothetical protein